MSKKEEPKIAKLNTEYAKKQYAQFQKQHREVVFKRRRMIAAIIAAAAIFCFVGVQLFHDHQRLQELNQIKAESLADKKTAEEAVTSLKGDVKLLKDDDYVAKLARSKFFYSKNGEQIYVLPDNISDGASSNNDTTDSKESAVSDAETVIESNQGN